jgi:protoporphyrinogen/coproporphyrinogen III oxidase
MRVAVIGGGVAGLAAAHELVRRGAEPVVFEAAGRAGGKVGTRTEEGWVTEDGPNFLAKPLDALLDASGLRAEVVKPQPPTTRWVHLGGRVLKAPSLGLLARAGAFRAFLEPFFARPLREDVSLRDFLEQRLGARAGGLAAILMSAGVYAGDPALLSARDAFPTIGELGAKGSLIVNAMRRPKGPPRTGLWTLRRGLGSLVEGVAAGLPDRLRLGRKVTRLSPAARGWEVEGESFDAVVLALPAAQAAELSRPFAPRFAEAVSGFRTARVTVVHLGFPQDGLPRGFGMLDADGTLHGIGTLLPSSMLPGRAPEGRALVTAICGGAKHPERAELADAALVSGILKDLQRTWALKADPEYVRVVRWGAAIPQYAPGHRDAVRAAREQLSGLPPVEVAGASYDGVGVPDVARSGIAAATRLCGT